MYRLKYTPTSEEVMKKGGRGKNEMKAGDVTFHIGTKAGDLAPSCLLVGSPGRARKIARELFTDAVQVGYLDEDDRSRCVRSYTGFSANGFPISVVTTHMGCPTEGIILHEAVESGARRFIRVGTCGDFANHKIGDANIWIAAVRRDGASLNWAPANFPAYAEPRVVMALVDAALELGLPYNTGVGLTTDCVREGQGRPGLGGRRSKRLEAEIAELTDECGADFASMEESGLFVWAHTHGRFWAGAVDANICNRRKDILQHGGELEAAQIAIRALEILEKTYPLKFFPPGTSR